MRFKIDENIACECASVLNASGHDAVSVHDQGMSGAPDNFLAGVCMGEQRIILTADLGFARADGQGLKIPGAIVFRLRDQSRENQVNTTRRLIVALERDDPCGVVWIVEDERIRKRRLDNTD